MTEIKFQDRRVYLIVPNVIHIWYNNRQKLLKS